MSCRSPFKWFDFAKNNDTQQILRYADKNAGQYDQRETNSQLKVFNGFAAIHYAVLFDHLETFQFLEQFELELLTRDATVQPDPYHDGCEIELASKSNVLQIAMIHNCEKVAAYILQNLIQETEKYQFLFDQNENGFNFYTNALALPENRLTLAILNNEKFFSRIIQQQYEQERTFTKMYYQNPNYKLYLIKELLQRDDDTTLFMMCKITQCFWLINVMMDAYKFCIENDQNEIVSLFMGNQTLDQIFDESITDIFDAFQNGQLIKM